MKLEEGLRLVAGTFILGSVLLAVFHSHWWLLLTDFVGFNLLQSAFTKWCPMMWILQKVGFKGSACCQGESKIKYN